jgi:hypothetical protein
MRPNLFTLLHMASIMFGGMIGASVGFNVFGFPGGVIAGVLGAMLGYFVGYTCNSICNFFFVRSYSRMSTPALRARLIETHIPGTFVSTLIISLLLERGEPVDSFREYIFRQFNTTDVAWRRAGIYNLGLCYPELAAKLEGFNCFHPTEKDLKRLKEIESTPSNCENK